MTSSDESSFQATIFFNVVTQVGIVDRGTRVLLIRSSRLHLRSRRGITASVCVRVRVRMHVCVCVWVHALRENVNVVMNPERSLVIGAIDRNHLMHPDDGVK